MSEPIKSDQEVVCRLCSYVIFAWSEEQAAIEWNMLTDDPKMPTPHWDYEQEGMRACNRPTECPNCGYANPEGMEHIDNSPEAKEIQLQAEYDDVIEEGNDRQWLGDPDGWKKDS